MTREKSDAQLDAEAEARRRHLDPPPVEHGFDDPNELDAPTFRPSPPPLPAPPSSTPTLDLHRKLYHDDNRLPRLVSRQPPLTRYEKGDDEERTGANEEYVYERGARVGMPMSGAMIRRLSENPGELYPWVSAHKILRQDCRRNHSQHRREDRRYWQGALCWKIVQLTVIRDFTPDEAAQILRLDSPEPVLSRALLFIEESIDHARARAEKRAREDEGRALTCVCGHGWNRHGGVAANFRCLDECGCSRYRADTEQSMHHVPSEGHSAECPNPVCRARRAA